MEFSFNFDDKRFLEGLEKGLKLGIDAIERGVFAAAEQLKNDSTDIVPFDEGFNGGLAGSAAVSKPRTLGSTIESDTTYNKVYAVKLHEDMSLNISQKNTSNGQRRSQKYLEKPMKQNAQKYGKIISDYVSQAL